MSIEVRNDSAVQNPEKINLSEKEIKQNKGFGIYSNTVIFLILIFGFTIASIISPERGFSENENRVLASRPEFSWENLFEGTYITDYETYVTDQFVLRDAWIGLKTRVELALLKKDINGVYFGKDGYLIEKLEESEIDQELLEKNTNRLEQFVGRYKELLGEEHVYAMIVPTAFEILSEKLPPFATGFDQGAYLDRLSAILGDNFIDLRDSLNAHDDEEIFYKTDHHWTVNGAFYAYQTWADAMGFTPLSKSDFTIKVVSEDFLGTIYSKVNVKVPADKMEIYDTTNSYQVEYNMDGNIKNSLYEFRHLNTKDKYAMYLNGNNPVVEINTENKNNKKLLIIKDSYAHCFAPFAVNHFETTYMVDLRYLSMPMSQFIREYGITDVLVLYNTNSFIKDKNLLFMVR